MAELIYEEPSKYSREEADRIFLSGDPAEITRLMIGLSYYDEDWRWVQDHCIRLSEDNDPQLRYSATVALSHLARIHGQLELNKVRHVLLRLESDEDENVRGSTEDMIEDIEHFLEIDLHDASKFN